MQNSSSALRFAGDVELKEIQLNSLNGQYANVTAQVERIEIYEDLFSPFTTLSIVLRESVDYINLFPFVGEEFVDVHIVTPTVDAPIKGRFYIYKITDREYTREREVVYAIKAVSEEFLTDANTKISKSFSGNASEIAAKLFSKEGLNTKKNVYIEQALNATKFTANFWTPTKCISYLTTNTISKTKSPSYLFYESRSGYNFRSINELLNSQTYHKLVKDNYSRTPQSDGVNSIKDPKEDYKRVIDLSVPVLTDYMSDIQSGRLKSRMISHDILTKKYTVKDYNIKKDQDPSALLNEAPAYSKYATANAASTFIFMPKHYGNFNNYTDVTNSKTYQKRLSFFQSLNKFKINVTAFGRTDYTVGQVFDLYIPKVTQITLDDNDPRDKILSGRYLVAAISHVITRENHTCNFELIKNSVITDLSKG